MDLCCPKCNSTHVKKVSLAYEEGLYRSNADTRVRGVLVGSGGPTILVGGAATNGTQQTVLSRRLAPPKKWSNRKLVIGFAILSFVALVAYIQSVMGSASTASSLPVKLYGLVAPCFFVVLVLVTWRHNHSTFLQEYAEWDRSFMCQRCEAVFTQPT